jgi:chaperonin cofactor prefoldin
MMSDFDIGYVDDKINNKITSVEEICRCLQIQLDEMGNQMNKLQTRIDEVERKIQW